MQMGYTMKSAGALAGRIAPGDEIIAIDGEPLEDIVDYAFFMAKDFVKVTYKNDRGALKTLKRVPGEALGGVEFAQSLLCAPRECANKCVFCFVCQLPRGLRRSLYVRDDDWRYSLLYGAYVTLSNISDEELGRIIRRGARPLYISVHASNDGVRRALLRNPDAKSITHILERLGEGGITYHAQTVVCPGYNDGEVFDETVEYLYSQKRCLSLAAVPVGLTKYKSALVTPMSRQDAADIIARSKLFAGRALKERGKRFVFCSDEMYLKAGEPLPLYDEYEDFPQIENGVGLLASFMRDVEENASLRADEKPAVAKMSIATGVDAYPFVLEAAQKLMKAFGVQIIVYPVKNLFFGESVTVAGLLTGADLLRALSGMELGGLLALSPYMVREGVFLDDMTVKELSQKLGVQINTGGIESLPFLGD